MVNKPAFTPASHSTRRQVADLLGDAVLRELVRPDSSLPYEGPIAEFAPLVRILEPAIPLRADNRLSVYRLYVRAYLARLDQRAHSAAEASGNPLVYWRWVMMINWTRAKLEWQGVRFALGWPVDHLLLKDLVGELGDPLR